MHEQHRERLKVRFLSEGMDSFDPLQALELLLFYALPRRDTNPIAHRLMERYGSFSAVLDADPLDLEKVEGMGPNSALLLAMMKPLWRLYRRDSSQHGMPMDNYRAACAFSIDLFAGRTKEALFMLCLDPSCRLIREVLLHEGTVNEVSVHPRTIVESALRNNASQVILVHNHPLGQLEPSGNDLIFTRKLAIALSAIGISMADHIIVSGEQAYSFAHEGRMERILREVEVRITMDVTAYLNGQSAPAGTAIPLSAHQNRYQF